MDVLRDLVIQARKQILVVFDLTSCNGAAQQGLDMGVMPTGAVQGPLSPEPRVAVPGDNRLSSSPMHPVTGQEDMATNCTRRD